MSEKNRYERNLGAISSAEQKVLAKSKVCIVGCGGLGGGAIEALVRLGVGTGGYMDSGADSMEALGGYITVVDCDSFDPTNLNRQVLSNENNLGHAKATEAKLQMKQINSEVNIFSVQAELDEENVIDIIGGHQVVIDALDNIRTRLILEEACAKEEIPLIHGAIGGWYGQVGVAMPGAGLLRSIYGEEDQCCEQAEGNLPNPGNLPFVAAAISAMQAAEAVKVLLGKSTLKNRLLTVELLSSEYEIIDF